MRLLWNSSASYDLDKAFGSQDEINFKGKLDAETAFVERLQPRVSA